MENQPNTQKPKIKLPLIALFLAVAPWFLFPAMDELNLILPPSWRWLTSFVFFFALLSMLAAVVLGIVSLTHGRKGIGTLGMVFAILAIVIIAIPVLFVIALSVGASTGLISLM